MANLDLGRCRPRRAPHGLWPGGAGAGQGQNLAFVSDNRPNVYMGFAAVQSLGAVPIPLYQDAVAQEMAFVMEDADIHFAFAEDQEQVDKLLEVRETVPSITHIIYDDPRGLRKYEEPGLDQHRRAEKARCRLGRRPPRCVGQHAAACAG